MCVGGLAGMPPLWFGIWNDSTGEGVLGAIAGQGEKNLGTWASVQGCLMLIHHTHHWALVFIA